MDDAHLELKLEPWSNPPGVSTKPRENSSLEMLNADSEVKPLKEIEEAAIRFAIAHYKGQMSEVARRLGMGRSTLYRKLDEYTYRKNKTAPA